MARKTWRGQTFDANTYDKLVELNKLVGPNIPIRPTQGSYSSGVAASAGTHDGGGAVDLDVSDLTPDQIKLVVFLARRIGFAAWLRTPDEGNWGAHIHCINKDAADLSSGARAQVRDYLAGKNGLRGHAADRHSALEAPREATWKSYLANWSVRKLIKR